MKRAKSFASASRKVAPSFIKISGQLAAIPKSDKMAKKLALAGELSRAHFPRDGTYHLVWQGNVYNVSHKLLM